MLFNLVIQSLFKDNCACIHFAIRFIKTYQAHIPFWWKGIKAIIIIKHHNKKNALVISPCSGDPITSCTLWTCEQFRKCKEKICVQLMPLQKSYRGVKCFFSARIFSLFLLQFTKSGAKTKKILLCKVLWYLLLFYMLTCGMFALEFVMVYARETPTS